MWVLIEKKRLHVDVESLEELKCEMENFHDHGEWSPSSLVLML